MKISIRIVIAVSTLTILYLSYNAYNTGRVFKLSESAVEMHYYLFEDVEINNRTARDLLEASLRGDSAAIVSYSTADLLKLPPSLSSDDKSEFIKEYDCSLWVVVEKIGDKRFCEIVRDLSWKERSQIDDNILRDDEYGNPYNHEMRDKHEAMIRCMWGLSY